jgi:hypothetical protein
LVRDISEVEDAGEAATFALFDEPTGLREISLWILLGLILGVRQDREGEGTFGRQGRLAIHEDRIGVRVGLGLDGRRLGLGGAGYKRQAAEREGPAGQEKITAGRLKAVLF